MGFESWLERDNLMVLDFDPLVMRLSSQPFWLSWQAGDCGRRHVPDYFARLADGSGVVIDVRPDDRIGVVRADLRRATLTTATTLSVEASAA